MRTGTTLISRCFSEAWTGRRGLTIADSLSLRVRNFGILQEAVSEEVACDQTGKPSTPPSSMPSTHHITSIIVSFRMNMLLYTTKTLPHTPMYYF